jgi:hypothetical protein
LEGNEGVVRLGFEQDGCRAIINRQEFEASEVRAYCRLIHQASKERPLCLRHACSGLESIAGYQRRHSRATHYLLLACYYPIFHFVYTFVSCSSLNSHPAIMSDALPDSSTHLEPPSKTIEREDPGASDNSMLFSPKFTLHHFIRGESQRILDL